MVTKKKRKEKPIHETFRVPFPKILSIELAVSYSFRFCLYLGWPRQKSVLCLI